MVNISNMLRYCIEQNKTKNKKRKLAIDSKGILNSLNNNLIFPLLLLLVWFMTKKHDESFKKYIMCTGT